MTKATLLIPVDFSIESLNTLKIALSQVQWSKVNIILMYATTAGDSIIDLLFYTPGKTITALSSPEFEEAIAIIRNRYETVIESLSIKLFHGYNGNALNNFIQAHGVTQIYIPQNYRLKLHRNGFDPLPMLRKSKLPVEEIHWEPNPDQSEEGQLSALFSTGL